MASKGHPEKKRRLGARPRKIDTHYPLNKYYYLKKNEQLLLISITMLQQQQQPISYKEFTQLHNLDYKPHQQQCVDWCLKQEGAPIREPICSFGIASGNPTVPRTLVPEPLLETPRVGRSPYPEPLLDYPCTPSLGAQDPDKGQSPTTEASLPTKWAWAKPSKSSHSSTPIHSQPHSLVVWCRPRPMARSPHQTRQSISTRCVSTTTAPLAKSTTSPPPPPPPPTQTTHPAPHTHSAHNKTKP